MAKDLNLHTLIYNVMESEAVYRNKYDWSGECSERGFTAEEFFTLKANENGFIVKKASKNDDMFKKIDFFFKKSAEIYKNDVDCNVIYTCDVKAMKKINRNDVAPQDIWTWIELHGVYEKDAGWLYGGHSDFIAFETRRGFLIVPRILLIERVEELVDTKTRVRTPEEAGYKVYQRPGRYDEITMIEKKYLLDIVWAVWK